MSPQPWAHGSHPTSLMGPWGSCCTRTRDTCRARSCGLLPGLLGCLQRWKNGGSFPRPLTNTWSSAQTAGDLVALTLRQNVTVTRSQLPAAINGGRGLATWFVSFPEQTSAQSIACACSELFPDVTVNQTPGTHGDTEGPRGRAHTLSILVLAFRHTGFSG